MAGCKGGQSAIRRSKRNLKLKAQLPQPLQLQKFNFFYFETLRKLRGGLKSLKFVEL